MKIHSVDSYANVSKKGCSEGIKKLEKGKMQGWGEK